MNNEIFQISKIRKIFKANKVEFAYIFGSMAKGKMAKESDVDIAVFLTEPDRYKRFNTRLKLITEIEKIFNEKADIVILNDIASIFFKYVIISEGKNIFDGNPSQRIETECRIHSEYIDFKPFLDEYHNKFLNKKIYA